MSNKKMLAGGIAIGLLIGCIGGGAGYVFAQKDRKTAGSEAGLQETLNLDGEELMNQAALNKLDKIYALVDQYYLEDVDKDALVEGAYKGIVDALGDPYSVYYDMEETKALTESIEGTYSGIGASLTKNPETGAITVVKCFEGAPAAEDGLLPGDQITEVDGTDILEMDLSSAVALIKGPENTEVVLSVYREGETDYKDITITRKNIDIPTVEYEMLDDQIGYIELTNFEDVSTKQFDEAFQKLQKQGMQGLVLDLRDNPGGIMDIACDVCEYFMDEGIIVYTEDKYGNRTEYKAEDTDSFDKPTAVLVNGNSASASEIVAGALQDTKKATIVGTQTFGKGIVQQILDLGDNTALKLTFSKYYTPNGNNIHGTGITPDVEVELDENLLTQVTIDKSEDNQLRKALEIVRGQLPQK